MKFNERLKELRLSRELTQEEFAKRIGISRSAVGMYEKGKREPDFETLELFADFFNVDMNYLLGKSDVNTDISSIKNIVPIEKKMIPIIGTIAAGKPITADEHIETYLPCDIDVHADFGLIVHGDSMIGAGIHDGDVVFIKEQPDVDNGQIAAVRIDDEATLKHVYKIPGGCMLVSENPKYPPMTFTEENCDDIHIIGLAVAKYSVINQ